MDRYTNQDFQYRGFYIVKENGGYNIFNSWTGDFIGYGNSPKEAQKIVDSLNNE